MSYYSYERYFHLRIDDLSRDEAQKVCIKLIELFVSFNVTNVVYNSRTLFRINVETDEAYILTEIELFLESLNIDIVI